MNFEIDFNKLSPAEIELRCRQIAAQKDALENDLRRQESDLQQAQARWRQHRQQAQMLLERLIVALLPDLSAPVKFRLAQIFPHHQELFRDLPPQQQSQKDFWQDISTFFSDLFGSAPNRLEETRVLLRNILWQLNEIPPNAGEFTEFFRAFLDAKNNYFALDRAVNQQEAQANRTLGQVNELSRQLRRCRDWIYGRPDEDGTEDDSRIYQQTFDHRPPTDTNITPAPPVTDSSRIDSSGDAAKAGFEPSSDTAGQSAGSSSGEAFSGFGGGGDFAGGGAGGSWENYS